MSDTKISALTSATTPLAGTEVLPIVQSSTTVKVAVNDLTVRNIRAAATTGILQVSGPTAGTTRTVTVPDANYTVARTDAAQSFTGDQTLSTGNLIQGTAAKGINFTANTPASGKTSQLLNWYEEGTWTPTILFGGANVGMTYGYQLGRYIRIGRNVYINCYVYPSNKGSSTGVVTISGLPFTSSSTAGNAHALSVWLTTFTFGISINPTARIVPSATEIQMYFMNTGTAAQMTDTQVNVSSEFTVTGMYQI